MFVMIDGFGGVTTKVLDGDRGCSSQITMEEMVEGEWLVGNGDGEWFGWAWWPVFLSGLWKMKENRVGYMSENVGTVWGSGLKCDCGIEGKTIDLSG
ncbi:unnamed protein product [Sphenostylis stenocarpa]|uniref:Uncharacterized protein n=1 Tax=Sphenostylis stenocarpa TaxID=92480 RepID=A0AA86VUT6_9FABA|nr:unnamed protein product [Sphenostylis stenocarpa]